MYLRHRLEKQVSQRPRSYKTAFASSITFGDVRSNHGTQPSAVYPTSTHLMRQRSAHTVHGSRRIAVTPGLGPAMTITARMAIRPLAGPAPPMMPADVALTSVS